MQSPQRHTLSNARSLYACLVVALLLPAVSSARAQDGDAIEIEVYSREAERAAIVLAVPDAMNLGSSDPALIQATISRTLRRDLGLACYFDLLGPANFAHDQHADGMDHPNYHAWRLGGAQGLVKTAFRVSGQQVYLDFRLFNVESATPVELDWEPHPANINDIEREVHLFANQIILFYSGYLGPFGSRVAFVGEHSSGAREIYTMTVGGTGPSAVTNNGSINIIPGWAGSDVLYTSYRDGNPNLYVSGSSPRLISSRSGLNMGGTMSPDGSSIALVLTEDGDAEIFLISPSDGSVQAQLTTNRGEDVEPCWSPDGNQIAFVSDRSGGPQIYVMNRDGSDQRRVTFAGSYNTTPDWSSDGYTVAFTGRDQSNNFDIFTIDVNSSVVQRITQNQGHNQHPSWSADGQFLVFSSNRSGGENLWISTWDGARQSQLTRDGGYTEPVWRH